MTVVTAHALVLSVFLLAASQIGSFAAEPAATWPCGTQTSVSGIFLHCTIEAMAAMDGTTPKEQVPLTDPIRGYLQTLAAEVGFNAADSDMAALKQRSTDLKAEPRANHAAIAILDSAVASQADELRAAVSIKVAAATAPPGTDIYPKFVQRKLAFLQSDKARFYFGGPFEVPVLGLWATSLEATYFLNQHSATADQLLRDEIKVVDEIFKRYKDDKYNYAGVDVTNGKAELTVIDFGERASRFWQGKRTRQSKFYAISRNVMHHST
jgi:hypothetical protein